MNIIVAMEKWCDLNPSLGITSANSNVLGSLYCTNNSFEFFYYDEHLAKHNSSIDEFLINHVGTYKPDALAVSYYPVDGDGRNIKLETFRKIKEMGIPVIFIWFDFGHPHIEKLALKCSNYNTLNVVVDVYKEPKQNFLAMWVPQDERLFHWQDHKPINVCFTGTKDAYDERRRYLNFLKPKINLTVSGGQREARLTIEQYAQMLKNSKISLNFPSKPDGTIQAKCRIYESMLSGALLLERSNEAINKWFEPMVHYVPFSNEGDLLNKIQYYLKNDSERLTIARCGHEKMKEAYSSDNWWNAVVTRARSLM